LEFADDADAYERGSAVLPPELERTHFSVLVRVLFDGTHCCSCNNGAERLF
jgi:hypothetical protein